jgi:hypothetical protein
MYMNWSADDNTITITPKNPESRWVALDENDNIISEGKTPEEVIKEAKKKSADYFLMFIPEEGNTYIF